jgi:hypothetical protein
MSRRFNALDQALDIAGSLVKSASMTLADENSSLGAAVSGQSGSAASINESGGVVTVTGLTGMSTASVGRFLTVSNGDHPGTYLIDSYISATSVTIDSSVHTGADSGNPTIAWVEREPYSLQDDINFARTDRAAIKGVNYYAAVPTYQRPTAVGTSVPANLSNLAGKSLDAKALVVNRKQSAQSVTTSTTFQLITDTGNLKHADATDRTGVPIFDGSDAGDHVATYVEIIDPATESALEVLSGGDAGKRIYGRTRAGSTSTSPNSVEVEFRAVAKGAALSTSVAYTWESGQPTTVDMFYGFRVRMDQMSENDLRVVLASGIQSDADLAQDIKDIRTTIDAAFTDGATSLAGLLTNTGNYFVFSDLPDVTPSIVEALNTINAQIGNRTYIGAILGSGDTVTESLQELATAIAGITSFVRTIERLSSDINAGTEHTLPGSLSYTIDATNNGRNLWVFWRGLLRDPGPVTGGNDYDETSTTSITPYTKIRAGDHISYFVKT